MMLHRTGLGVLLNRIITVIN